ncbi:Ppx/GppA phosphatase family protein [Stackebrandtia nassauensis]|uniref:Ppx/GppA phosphatase n=1 Tax=Stackebrandtia nassauensis (strain DSM 44728 / CIP 108903 / NRRL B-16338 / NBRC 102104 / LLR-40K-21) TaxID=446470 RepID=D3PZ23_STANL|nr:Ppx/GppA phosphatase family protein [Stackebrandtia nassauensis]ADD45452.1 Ppx/GppA phosphatase [Stackebrandtia nassauensis DSM 44728]
MNADKVSRELDYRSAPTTVAAIDCGTNSIRLLISRQSSDAAKPTDLVRIMRIVRLGEGVDTTGRISPAALDRTAAALREYAALIAEHQPSAVRMVATSASRDADNAAEFRDLVHGILGVMPEVITGDEEARLSFTGAVADLPPAAEPRLVVDIGGGSTEFVLGTDQAGPARSMDIGCVRMTERHLRGDPPSAEQVAAAEADITARVDEALATVDPNRTATELIGLAGSVTTVAALALGLDTYQPERIHHAEISYDDVRKVTMALLGQTREERLAHGVMHPGRADVIGGGALVLRIIMERCGATSVIASEHDILDGIAASLA